MKKHALLILIGSIMLQGCVVSSSAAKKNTDGTTEAGCLDSCIDETGNQELCTRFAKDARASCGDLIKKVCEAEESGSCGA